MKRNKKSHSEINYWQSNTDMMTGLVLVLVLIILLLILYLMRIPEEREPDAYEGDSYNVDSELGDALGGDYGDEDFQDHVDFDMDGFGNGYGVEDGVDEVHTGDDETAGGGGGGGGAGGGDDYGGDYEFPYPPTSGDDWGKAAVYATVVDEETGRAIRKAGLTFELYEEQRAGDGGTIRFLNTYYPEKKEYRNYSTTEEGVFYLPEKIEEGNYYFKQITGLEGYDLAEAVDFHVDDVYDWSDPYVVSIEASPSKNVIPISVTDLETEQPVSGGTFEITAAEDIRTADETVRYAKDQVADTVTIDDEGYGESDELYLGRYIVSQKKIPQYYASIGEGTETVVEQKDEGTPDTIKFVCEKTRISLTLSDEIYNNQKLEGAEFSLTCDGYPELTQEAETDENGELTFTDLEKNRTYELRQLNAPDDYIFEDGATEITVSEDGRIDGNAEISFEFTNYIPRINIDIKDRIMGESISDLSVSLYNSNDELVQTWTTGGSEKTFENLAEGSYYILLDGNESKKYEFDFSEDEALQQYSVSIWTVENIIMLVVGGVAVLCVGGIVTVIIRKIIRKGKKS